MCAGRERLADFERGGLLARDPERRVGVHERDPEVGPGFGLAVVGHGTERNENSAKAVEYHADRIREMDRFEEVQALFMDEDPEVDDVTDFFESDDIVVVPLFIADGFHTQEDIPEDVGLTDDYREGYDVPAVVDGHRIPEGTVVTLPQFRLHTDPRFWDEPDAFRPERWLEPEPDAPAQASNLFLRGPRGCPGEDLILFVCKAALAHQLGESRGTRGSGELGAPVHLRPAARSSRLARDPLPVSFPDREAAHIHQGDA